MRREFQMGPRPETKEKLKELFRATLGFDFIFSLNANGEKQCFCVEINGHDSGIAGVQAIPKGGIDPVKKISDAIRGRLSEERRQANVEMIAILDAHDEAEQPEDTVHISRALKQKVQGIPFFTHAVTNPPFIENIGRDKTMQVHYIPEEFRPRTHLPGESSISSTGYWICKPKNGLGGKGITILSNKYFAQECARSGFENQFVAQEFMPPLGADNAAPGQEHHPASMRLLMDFRYMSDGSIEPMYESAYQRISPFSAEENAYPSDSPNPIPAREDIFVVNRARNALSAAVSVEELAQGRAIARAIIGKIGESFVRHHKKET